MVGATDYNAQTQTGKAATNDNGGSANTGGNGGGGDFPQPDYGDPNFQLFFDDDGPQPQPGPEIVGDKSKLPPTTIQIRGYTAALVAKLVDESVDALIHHNVPIFSRNRMLFTVLWEKRRTDENRWTKVAALVPVDIDHLDYTLNKGVAIYLQMKKVTLPDGSAQTQLVPVGAPDRVLKRIVGVKHWKFAPIIGLIMCPTMRPDGSLLLTKGYDAATGFYAFWDDGLVLPPIPEQPTKDDTHAALQLLLELIAGFPFVNEVDKAVAIAAIMTPVLRVAFDFAPMYLLRAHQSGTGKSFMQDVISAIVNGRRCPVIDVSDDKTEMQKQLGSLLLEGTPIIALDNLDHDLKSSLLCQIISQPAVQIRILGKSKAPAIEWRGTLICNGNNIKVIGDLVRRTLIANMNVAMERPETRDFTFNPVHRVLEDRGKYIAAVLTIARAYLVCQNKIKLTNFSGLEGWSRIVREALCWLGMEDPVHSQKQSYKDDPYRSAARIFYAQWKEQFGTEESYKAKDILDAAIEREPILNARGEQIWRTDGGPETKLKRQELYDLLMEQCGERGTINPKQFGYWLRALHNQVHALEGDDEVPAGSYRLTIAKQSEHGHRWKLEQV